MSHAVTLILYNNDRELLLQLRDEHAQKNPNQWAFFGGAIEKGELPEQAIRREAKEELGYVLQNPQLVLTENILNDGTKYLFFERFDTTQALNLGEGKAMRWFPLQEISTLNMVTSHRERLAKFMVSVKKSPFGNPKER